MGVRRATSQTITRRSSDAEASSLPSRLNETLLTNCVWPTKAGIVRSNRATVRSTLPDARVWPSGLNARAVTVSVCSVRARSRVRVATFQSTTSRSSSPPVASVRPSGLKASAPVVQSLTSSWRWIRGSRSQR
jgi:hypothetical protein